MKGIAKSLSARTTLVLLAGMLVSNAIGLIIFSGERSLALSTAAGATTAARIVSIVRTVATLPVAERQSALCSQSGSGLALALSDQPIAQGIDRSARARSLAKVLQGASGLVGSKSLIIAKYSVENRAFSASMTGCGGASDPAMRTMMPSQQMQMSGPMARNMRAWQYNNSLVLSYPLRNGTWLNILAPKPRFLPFWKSRFLLAFVAMAAIVAALSVWAARYTTAPLAMFANAAEQLGRDVDAPDLPETGPREVGKAARAFNEMQHRLRRLIRSRTMMLAAISHDLRTPITRLRLRAEFVDDSVQRDKMLTDLEQMETMIAATLAFARLDNRAEKPRRLDLAGLVDVACNDAAELGQDVRLVTVEPAKVTGRPVALRRVLDNIIDNAVKYGQRARVGVTSTPGSHIITVDDDGPGIPEAELEQVFDAFHRVDPSRNPETGGVGLGLAVVRAIVDGHSGNITLKNRVNGGLRVTITLPRDIA